MSYPLTHTHCIVDYTQQTATNCGQALDNLFLGFSKCFIAKIIYEHFKSVLYTLNIEY